MKLLTVTVPCYNSEAYMRKCLDSLIPGGKDVEVLIVDDGSDKDRTPEIADEYAAKYPDIVRVIHQENKGHGGAVNTGIRNAEGLYFKVVDSDDWVNDEAWQKLLSTLRKIVYGGMNVDAVLNNFVYEKVGQKRKLVMHYDGYFPVDQVFTWKDTRPLPPYKYVLMHSLTYRTQLLRDCGLELPEHTFYVDNIYAYIPMAYVKTMYYLNVNLYRYFIGRSDQSVNEEVMTGRVDQQLRINYIMIDFMQVEGKKLKGKQWKFIMHSLSTIMTVSSIFLLKIGTKEALQKKKELWQRLRATDMGAYHYIRLGILGMGMNIPGILGRKFTVQAYRVVRRIYGFS